MKHLTRGQMLALKVAGEYFLQQWPNEGTNYQLRVALEKLDDGMKGREVNGRNQATRRRINRAPTGS